MDVPLLKKIQCKRCGLIFYMCRSCWRGHVYCSDPCRVAARLEKQRAAQRKYRQTDKGRKAHIKGERKRREKKNRKSKNTMDDTGSKPQSTHDNVPTKLPGGEIRCHFCGSYGVVVNDFPRQDYCGKKATSRNAAGSG